MLRAGLMAAAVALLLAGCGEEDAPEGGSSREPVSVCEVARSAGELSEVKVEGAAYAPARRGFLLSDGGCSVFVASTSNETVAARGGARVLVAGIVDSMRASEVEIIQRLLREAAGDGGRNRTVARRASASPGAPFIDAFWLRGEDLVPPEG